MATSSLPQTSEESHQQLTQPSKIEEGDEDREIRFLSQSAAINQIKQSASTIRGWLKQHPTATSSPRSIILALEFTKAYRDLAESYYVAHQTVFSQMNPLMFIQEEIRSRRYIEEASTVKSGTRHYETVSAVRETEKNARLMTQGIREIRQRSGKKPSRSLVRRQFSGGLETSK